MKPISLKLLVFFIWASYGLYAEKVSPPPASEILENPNTQKDISLSQDKKDTNNLIDKLVFVDESAQQLFSVVEFLTGKTVIPSQDIPQVKINVKIEKATKEEALIAIESALNLNGVAITEMGDRFLKAIPVSKIRNQAPTLLMGRLRDMPASQKVYSKLFELKFLPVQDITLMMYPMLTPITASMTNCEKANAVLITDTLSNLQKIEALLETLDKPSKIENEVLFVQLHCVSATELQKRLSKLQDGGLKRIFKGNTSFEADDRTNQLIVYAPVDNHSMIQRIIKSLDIDMPMLVKSEAFYIKHGEAKTICDMVKKIISSQQEKAKESEKTAAKSTTLQNPFTKSNQPDSSSDNMQFSKGITVEYDERSNAIVAFGNPADLRQIKELIDKVDTVLPQVRIDVIVAEVQLSKGEASGIQSFGLDMSHSTQKIGGTGTGQGIVSPPLDNTITPLSAGVFDAKHLSFSGIIQTAEKNQRVKILSSPSILTTHNKEAEISVSTKRPYLKDAVTEQTGSSSSNGQTATNAAYRQSVDWMDIGLSIVVKPLIGNNGIIQMDIKQKYENQIDLVSLVNGTYPITSKREAKSFVSAQDNDIIVLAGLQETQKSKIKSKMFLFGYLPLIGDTLFSPKSDSDKTTELVIFMKPHVSSIEDAGSYGKEMMEKHSSKQELSYFKSNGKFEDTSEKYKEIEKTRKGRISKKNKNNDLEV